MISYTCPITQLPLYPAPDRVLEALYERVQEGELRRVNGLTIAHAPAQALITLDGKIAYPIVSGVPLLSLSRAVNVADTDFANVGKPRLFGQNSEKLLSEFHFWADLRRRTDNFRGPQFEQLYTEFFEFHPMEFEQKRILDIGCGPLGTLNWCNNAQVRIGLDPLALAYRQLGTACHAMTYVEADCESLPFPDGYFDFVSSFNSIDHVDNLERVCREIERVTAPGGIFLVLTDIHDQPTVNEPQTIGWNFAESFDGFDCEVSYCLEKHLQGHYDSIFEKKPFDFNNKTHRYGMYVAKFKKKGITRHSAKRCDPLQSLNTLVLPWSVELLLGLYSSLPDEIKVILRNLFQESIRVNEDLSYDEYCQIVMASLAPSGQSKMSSEIAVNDYVTEFQLQYGFVLEQLIQFIGGRITDCGISSPSASLTAVSADALFESIGLS